jgi:hypothetical protein
VTIAVGASRDFSQRQSFSQPGTYTFEVVWQDSSSNWHQVPADAGVSRTATLNVVQPLAILSGVVTHGAGANKGLRGVTVSVSGSASRSATTDQTGNFSFTDLPYGNYTIEARLTGYTRYSASLAINQPSVVHNIRIVPNLRVSASLQLSKSAVYQDEEVIATVKLHNYGSEPFTTQQLGIGGRGPHPDQPGRVTDFPLIQTPVTIQPSQDYELPLANRTRRFLNEPPGQYLFFVAYQDMQGNWPDVPSDQGQSREAWLTVYAIDIRVTSSLSVSPNPAQVYAPVEATFKVKNFGPNAYTPRQLFVRGRGPGGIVRDFIYVDPTLQSGQEYEYRQSRLFDQEGQYNLDVAYQDASGAWRDVPAEPGISRSATLTVRQPDPDLGFRPDPDGFGFDNRDTARTLEMFVRFFGRDAVCSPNAQCDNSKPDTWRDSARRWFGAYSKKMKSCDGFSATSLLNFRQLDQPNSRPFDMPLVLNLYSATLNQTPNERIENAIAFQQGYWYSEEIIRLYNQCSQEFPQPSSFYNRIKDALTSRRPVILSFTDLKTVCYPIVGCLKEEIRHSVVPYRIDESEAGKGKVYVYENEIHGALNQFFEFDLSNYSWKYAFPFALDAHGDSQCPQGKKSGLFVMWLDYRLNVGDPPWDTNNTAAVGASNAEQRLSGSQNQEDTQQTTTTLVLTPSKSWLPLVRDQSGRRLGWVNGEVVSEIPGAYYFTLPEGSLELEGPVEDRPLSYFYLASGQRYTISLTALGGPAELTLIHSGGSVKLRSDNESPGATTELAISGDGLSMEASSPALSRSMSMSTAWEQSDGSVVAEAHEVPIGGSGTFKLSLLSGGRVSIVNSATTRTFELRLHRMSQNSGTFAHAGITIGANDTHFVQVSDWNNLTGANVQLQIDRGSDGTIDQTVSLENEASESWSLQPGWNLIAIPGNPQPAQSAESLGRLINNAGGHVSAILSWDGSGWQTHQVGLPFGDFPIWSATGYFVDSARSSQFTITGIRPPDEVFISLKAGWNLIGIPLGSYTAESMLQDIRQQGGNATSVLRWDGSGWQTHQIGLPFGDFNIEHDHGYFVYATQPSVWWPGQ